MTRQVILKDLNQAVARNQNWPAKYAAGERYTYQKKNLKSLSTKKFI